MKFVLAGLASVLCLLAQEPRTRELSDLNWSEFRGLVPSRIETVRLPTGTVEANGVIHNGADNSAPLALSRSMAPKVNALVAPLIPYGVTGSLDGVHAESLVSMRYVDGHGRPAATYPLNPNGSVDAIAGICDESGRLFGLMPHPEAFLHATNHPRWTRETLPEEGMGLLIFRRAIEFIRNNL